MNQKQKELLQLVGNALFGTETKVQLDETIIEEAKHQAVLGLIDLQAYSIIANNVQVTKAHADLCDLLKGIPFVIIKGCASAYYYPQPVRRTMGDVDFLVEQSYFDEAEKRLRSAGFSFDHETELHRCFRKSGISYEMHFAINGVPKDDVELTQMLEGTIQTSQEVHLNNNVIRIPDDFHNGLICLLHICSHLSRSEVGLRQLCDWACIVHRVSCFEELFRERLEQVGLWACACVFSRAAAKYLGLPYQKWMNEGNETTADELMEEIMDSGNMGRKQSDYETAWFVDQKGTGSKFKGLFSTLNTTIKECWPIVDYFCILYPLGWLFFSMRYAIRMLLGKRRKFNFSQTMQRAERKNQLLESLQLFVT